LFAIVEALLNSRSRLSATSTSFFNSLASIAKDIPYVCIEIPFDSDVPTGLGGHRKQPLGWVMSDAARDQLRWQARNLISRKRRILNWPPSAINLQQSYRTSVKDRILEKNGARTPPEEGERELSLPRVVSMRTRDLPDFAPCDALATPEGDIINQPDEDIVKVLYLIAAARSLVPERKLSDAKVEYIMAGKYSNGEDIVKFFDKSFERYIANVDAGSPIVDDSTPLGKGVMNQACCARWKLAGLLYAQALKMLHTSTNFASLVGRTNLEREVKQLESMEIGRFGELNAPSSIKATGLVFGLKGSYPLIDDIVESVANSAEAQSKVQYPATSTER
jgi:hypothetical protein